MKLDHPKQFHSLAGAPILIHTVKAFFDSPDIEQIIIVAPPEMVPSTEEMLSSHQLMTDQVKVVAGGVRRQDSVLKGIEALHADIDVVLVHDGARPLIQQQLIENCLEAAIKHGAAIAAIPVKDTLKKGNTDNLVAATVDRNGLWQAQTPQAAKLSLLKEAYSKNGDRDVTDESGLLEAAGITVHLVEGSETNLKVTRPEDLEIAEKLLKKDMTSTMRIGHGFDAHRFSENRDLVLGGVTIPHTHGLAGHSDADVLTHAICDALLGAVGLGDIGKHFPDSSDEFKDIYSINLLKKVIEELDTKGFSVNNIDATIICQRPKMAPHIDKMRTIIADTCRVKTEQINLKATTTEKMGFTGREEGISSHAVALIQSF